ncbi:MotA/TolQ/ExbB proton channel family protein [Achromobacter xylosoxidans]
MIGQIVQFVLYGLLALVVMLGVAGLFLVFQVRRGLIRPEVAMKMPLVGLALIASTAPYIGLFGTVWHITGALGGIGAGNLNVAAIAQPIGEALYATLWGLGSAIPALIMHRVLIALVPDEEPHQSSHAADAASASAQDSAK